jgi:hypothetical protein
MSLKKTLLERGAKVLSDPRVLKVMQDERVLKAAMAAMSVPAKAQAFARERVEGAAKALALATQAEVKDLRRTVRRLEDELAALRSERASRPPPPRS